MRYDLYVFFCRFRHDTGDLDSDIGSDLPETKVKGQTLRHTDNHFDLFGRKHGRTNNWGPVGFKKASHPLSIMVSCAE